LGKAHSRPQHGSEMKFFKITFSTAFSVYYIAQCIGSDAACLGIHASSNSHKIQV